jgi:mono/diheme cytochrome c family protein
VDPAVMTAGAAIYADRCSACHTADAQGAPRFFPPLAADPNIPAKHPTTLVRYILTGTATATTEARPTALSMLAFAWLLDDRQIAAVVTYIRDSWGNAAPSVSGAQAAKLRRGIAAPPVRPAPPNAYA